MPRVKTDARCGIGNYLKFLLCNIYKVYDQFVRDPMSNEDIISKNKHSLDEMGRDLERVGYTLITKTDTSLLYNALADENDDEYDHHWIQLSTDICYCEEDPEEEGPGYEEQYGFDGLYPTENEQNDVLNLIKQGDGIGVTMDSDQDVFVRWSKWKAHIVHFKQTIEWLANRTE